MLLTIRYSKLYREQFRTFSEYCNALWEMSRGYAARLIGGSQVMANLYAMADNFAPLVKPVFEKQIRPLLITLTVLEPAQQCEVWEKAVKTVPAGKTVTNKHVKDTVKELTAPAPDPKPPSVSHSGFAYSGPQRRAPFTPPTLTALGAPFRGHGGAVSGP